MKLSIKTDSMDVNIDENGFSGKIDTPEFKADGEFTWDQLQEAYEKLVPAVPRKARIHRDPTLLGIADA